MSTARGRGDRDGRAPRPRRVPAAGPAPLVLPQPTPWARERIAAARQLGPVPDYGSPAWSALPDEDPRKVAAALVYAEVARYAEATTEERVRREVEQLADAYEAGQVDAEIERGARAAQARDAWAAEGCRRLSEQVAASVAGRRPSARRLAIERGEITEAVRIDRQRERFTRVPSVEQLMRTRADAS